MGAPAQTSRKRWRGCAGGWGGGQGGGGRGQPRTVRLLVALDHPPAREGLARVLADLMAIQPADPIDREDRLLDVIDEITAHAVLDGLRVGAGAAGVGRRAGG